MKTKVTSFALDPALIQALKMRSYELSIKTGKRITMSAVVEKALLKFGIKPCTKPSK